MSEGIGELIMPGVRWNAERGSYDCEGGSFEEAAELGVGGYCFFGGTAAAAKELIADLQARSPVPLLIAADLERGAGQQFDGLTGLPPLAALGSLGDSETMRSAAEITAAEAASTGVNWIFAPVLDLDIEPTNPIIGTRAIGSDPEVVSRLGAAWIQGCQSMGVLACAKHFPGHGRTTKDSHATLPVVSASKEEMAPTDLAPFRTAIEAGVASIMSAHISFPALDPSGDPATLSRPILRGLLRREMGFEGLIVTDALIMEGVYGRADELSMPARALNAGIDLLLYPKDTRAVYEDLFRALADGKISAEHVRQSRDRRTSALARTTSLTTESVPPASWAGDVALEVIHVVRGSLPSIGRQVHVVIVDDDHGGPYPALSREPFLEELRKTGFGISDDGQTIIAVFGDIRAWKGRPGYSAKARSALSQALEANPDALVIQFSHPRLAAELTGRNLVCAWGGDAAMQRAAARWLGAPT